MLTRVAAYARVSTERQAESQTIEQQVDRLHAYAARQGWALQPERVYRDDGYSGARLDRPALDRLRDAVARGEVETLLVTSPDRLARRYAYQVWLLEECERAGCQVVFLERPPTGDPQDTLVLQIRGAVAEYERTVIADRTRRGRLAALRAGRLLPWSSPPYGYRLDPLHPRDPALVRLDEAAAATVRRIFAWYVEEGLTLYAIAQRLSAAGIPSATGRAFWSGSSVGKLLHNPCYAGTAYGNRQQMVPATRRYPLGLREPKALGGQSYRLRPEADWIAIPVPAIVSTERFALAQARLAQNRARARRNTRGAYLLRSLVSCGRCGLTHDIRNTGRQTYYHCTGRNAEVVRRRGAPCHAHQVPTARLDEVVWEDLCQVLADPTVLEEAVRRTRQGWLSEDERVARRRDLGRRQAQVQRQIRRVVEAYTVEALTLEELQAQRRFLEQRLAALRREEQQCAAEIVREDQAQALAARAEEFRAALADGLDRASPEQRRTLVELLVDRVVVDAPDVEIRYVIPLSGLARRNGVLRPRHRTPIARPAAVSAPCSASSQLTRRSTSSPALNPFGGTSAPDGTACPPHTIERSWPPASGRGGRSSGCLPPSPRAPEH